jgi:hypothetical protein
VPRSRVASGLTPLSPQRKWRAITFATLLLAPAVWAILAGLVAIAQDEDTGVPPGPAIAFGLCLVPFVFVVLAFSSEHPRAAGAAARAMGLCLLVGIPASAIAADAVTGLVAGIGAGGIVALRSDVGHRAANRAVGVAIAAAYAFVLARVAGGAVVLAAPILPFTAIGVADHFTEWRAMRAARR